ncbi:MAG TPA: DUF1841 family protein [Pirellulales bacterium]|nr:DUF1841 family protein [Pirellulales bacterium]
MAKGKPKGKPKRKLPPLRQLSEDEAWEIALNDHPEYREGIEDGTLPEEMLDERGELMNPRLHLTLHTIVEKQLAADEPKGMAEIARELAAVGVSRHNIRHAIATPLVEQLWAMQAEGAQFDEVEYLAQLRDIVDSYR